ncbi:MAG: DUF3575 domain-containing protein [Paludibacteraceae bacterium]
MKKTFIIIFLSIVSLTSTFAQADWSVSDGALLDGKNIIKVNLTSLPLRNYTFYGERIINQHMSVSLGVGFIPQGRLPLVDNFTSVTEQGVEGDILNMEVSSFAVIPEVRFYTGSSGYGRGFYVAPYLKYEKFGLDKVSVTFTDNDGDDRQIDLNGKLDTYSVGAMIGYQWLIGSRKNFVIDLSILGLHGGKSSGNMHGYYAIGEMTASEQQDVKENIDDTLDDIPLIKYTTTVDEKNADVSISGPWAFFRIGLSVGYRF